MNDFFSHAQFASRSLLESETRIWPLRDNAAGCITGQDRIKKRCSGCRSYLASSDVASTLHPLYRFLLERVCLTYASLSRSQHDPCRSARAPRGRDGGVSGRPLSLPRGARELLQKSIPIQKVISCWGSCRRLRKQW